MTRAKREPRRTLRVRPMWIVAGILLLTGVPACKRSNGTEVPPITPVAIQSGGEPLTPEMQAIFDAERARMKDVLPRERQNQRKLLLTRQLPPRALGHRFWTRFRQVYPYHIQVVSVTPRAIGGRFTFLVAEPPPHVALPDLLEAVGPLLAGYAVKKQRIGNDGWVKDVVLEARDDGTAAEILSRLNALLFHTSYKAYPLPLPPSAPRRGKWKLDLNVSAREIKKWVLDEQAKFLPIEGSDSVTAEGIFQRGESQVLICPEKGLVGWWIPKSQSVAANEVPARQFALDSDLVLGAITRPSGVLVIGRQRVVPLDVLPPLRGETLALLGAVQDDHLAQSYERNHLFAGRIDEQHDWAPILLSPELRDTEYGSLLNITDQLLKGWSNNGETRYVRFDYPRPAKWPFKKPLPEQLKADQLTYNWNTRGTGYMVKEGDGSVFALNRSGALPVSYIPKGQEDKPSTNVLIAETNAYNYFAGLNDPNLVRVVQYAAIYQIFRHFPVAQPAQALSADPVPDTRLEEMTSALMSQLRHLTPAQRRRVAGRLGKTVAATLGSADSVDSIVAELMPRYRREFAQRLQEAGISRGTSEFDQRLEILLKLARQDLRVSVREALSKDRQKIAQRIEKQLQLVAQQGEDAGANNEDETLRKIILSLYAASEKLPQRYAAAIDQRAKGWIHTPVVVLSWNIGSSSSSIGGHNLDAKITGFRLDNNVPKGKPIVKDGEIVLNPADSDKAGRLAFAAGRHAGEPDLPAMLTRLAKPSNTPLRQSYAALRFPEKAPASSDWGIVSFPRGETGKGVGWAKQTTFDSLLREELLVFRQNAPDAVLIARRNDGTFQVAHGEPPSWFKARTYEDAVDSLIHLRRHGEAGDKSLNIKLVGFEPKEMRSFLRSCEGRSKAEKLPPEIEAIVGNKRAKPVLHEIEGLSYKKAEIKFNDAVFRLPDGSQVRTGEVTIPAANGRTVKGTLKLIFHRTAPRHFIDAITQRIHKIFNRLKGSEVGRSGGTFHTQFNHEMKLLKEQTGRSLQDVELYLATQGGDVYLARQEADDAERRSGARRKWGTVHRTA